MYRKIMIAKMERMKQDRPVQKHTERRRERKKANNHCCSHFMLYSRCTMFEHNKYNNADITFNALVKRAFSKLTGRSSEMESSLRLQNLKKYIN